MGLNADTSRADKIRGLVARAIRGDAEAFGDLYAEYLDAIYRYVLLRVGDEASAEDLTEEVFVRAWEALPRYKAHKYPFSSWLYRIAHNLVVDAYRKHQSLSMPVDVEKVHLTILDDGTLVVREIELADDDDEHGEGHDADDADERDEDDDEHDDDDNDEHHDDHDDDE